MNIKTFNNDLSGNEFLQPRNGRPMQTIPDSVLSAPIFEWDNPPDEKLMSRPEDGNQDILNLVISEPNLLPFKQLRLYMNANAEDRACGVRGVKYWVSHENGFLEYAASVQPQQEALVYTTGTSGVIAAGVSSKDLILGASYGGRWVESSRLNPWDREDLQGKMQAMFTSFCWFIRELTSPATFMASVSPDKQGKSVEWTMARTHYVVLYRHHPANKREVAHGSEVEVGAGYTLRQAHTRRAHTRVLRSPRFRHKIGQTIRIAACWCGPKEWKQSGSIYRIVS